jgi:acetyl-CoA carboxylase biotin carboxylase subunit
MLRALDEMVITGVPTTAGYHKLILNHESFRAGDVDTGFIVKHAGGGDGVEAGAKRVT